MVGPCGPAPSFPPSPIPTTAEEAHFSFGGIAVCQDKSLIYILNCKQDSSRVAREADSRTYFKLLATRDLPRRAIPCCLQYNGFSACLQWVFKAKAY